MEKLLLLFMLILVGLSAVYAEEISAEAGEYKMIKAPDFKFKDMPDNYWAASSVYDLVKMGVTKGYPDGTFRGGKTITRYETAVFLSKLAKAMGGIELKQDVLQLKQEVAALQQGGPSGIKTSGNVLSDWKMGNVLSTTSTREAVGDYRLKFGTQSKINENAELKVNLDTMDYGYYNTSTTAGGNLPTQLLDVASTIKLNLEPLGLSDPVHLALTYGPGPQQHNADPTGALPSEIGIVYMRPDTGIMASTKLWGIDVIGGYLAKGKANTGQVTIGDLTGKLAYTFGNVPLLNTLKIEAGGNYIGTGVLSSTNRNIRAGVTLSAPLGQKMEASGTFGLGGREKENWMVSGNVKLNDVFETGTIAMIRASKVGSQFLNTSTFQSVEYYMAGLDTFDRAMENGTFNLGAEVNQLVGEDLKLVGKGELRLSNDYKYTSPKGRLTAQGGISYAIAPNTDFNAMYRVHQDKLTADTSDIASIGLNYVF